MLSVIKNAVRKQLHNRCYRMYQKELNKQTDDYAQWILENESWKKEKLRNKKNIKNMSAVTVGIVKMASFCENFQLPEEEILLMVREGGSLDSCASCAIADFFTEHEYVQMAYADEDCINEKGLRHTPWFKPNWSPDTLRSFAYYGNVLAIKRVTLEHALHVWKEEPERIQMLAEEGKLPSCISCLSYGKGEQNVYFVCLLIAALLGDIKANEPKKPIASIDKVLYHRQVEKNNILSDPDAAFSDSIYEDTEYPDLQWEDLQRDIQRKDESLQAKKDSLISIIIPSKDQPDVLSTCIESIVKLTGLTNHIKYEILVVDNGSTAHNRLKIEALTRKYDAKYLYQPMPFNFSIMCNAGAARANGDFLLFLNDDMEVIHEEWLVKLYELAKLPHVGAVGAKLLYPETDLIQHVGVTNLTVGPAHKLLKLHDENIYYHGQNRHNYDMIGVTAACLMVETRKFMEVDGYIEKLAVAYNDVELCFSFYEAGYYNVQRNDVVLYHHESLSRGDDLLSEEKKERLLKEKAILYELHPSLEGYDPFYSRHLAGMKHMYLCDYQYPYEREDYYLDAVPYENPEPVQWENNCLNVNVEIAHIQDKLRYREVPRAYHIEGWSYVLHMDNCHYQRKLLLIGQEGNCYIVPVLSRMRKDVSRILAEQENVALAGFVCRIRRSSLVPGTYTIAMLAKDGCSKQYLYKKTDTMLTVK